MSKTKTITRTAWALYDSVFGNLASHPRKCHPLTYETLVQAKFGRWMLAQVPVRVKVTYTYTVPERKAKPRAKGKGGW
jgi:hypothetical protein